MNLITPDFGLIFWQSTTLFAVLFVLRRFAWNPILDAIQEREQAIEQSLQDAEAAKKLIAQAQTEKEALLHTARKEHTQLVEEAVASKERIINDAHREAENMSKDLIRQTHVRLEQERKEALGALKNEVGILAIQIAEKLLKDELQRKGAQERLIQQLIKNASRN